MKMSGSYNGIIKVLCFLHEDIGTRVQTPTRNRRKYLFRNADFMRGL